MVVTFMPASNAPIMTLCIFYRLQLGSSTNYNHYDSVIHVEPLNQPVPSALTNDEEHQTMNDDKPSITEESTATHSRPVVNANHQNKPREDVLRLCTYNVRGCNEPDIQ